jgi:biotin carboxylase
MSSKKLLVLAASTYQLDVIHTARRLGYGVVTTDNIPTNPGHCLADRAYDVDTTDRERVLRISRDEGIAGIIAAATDVAVETAAYVASKLGIPGIDPGSASLLTSKLAFRRFQQDHELPHPSFHALDRNDTMPGAAFDGRQWVLKPNRSSGSKGIRILTTAAELSQFRDDAARYSLDGRAIIERLVPGTQHTCEGFLRHGEIAFAMITDRTTAKPPHTATAGHFTPTLLAESAQAAAREQIEAVFGELGITDGPFDCDFVATAEACTLLEIAPRLGGNSLSRLVRAAYDLDLVEAAVRFACGDLSELPSQRANRACAVLILGVETSGTLKFDSEAARSMATERWVRHLAIDCEPGTAVRAFRNGRDRVGEALIVADSRTELDRVARMLEQRLALTAVAAT